MTSLLDQIHNSNANLRALTRWTNALNAGDLADNATLENVRTGILALLDVARGELRSLAANECETQEMLAVELDTVEMSK